VETSLPAKAPHQSQDAEGSRPDDLEQLAEEGVAEMPSTIRARAYTENSGATADETSSKRCMPNLRSRSSLVRSELFASKSYLDSSEEVPKPKSK